MSGDVTVTHVPHGSLIGRLVAGRYLVERELGRGGMGTVYLATQTELGRDVALKVLGRELVGDPEAEERFLFEARAVSQLTSPHTVTLFDYGHLDDEARQPFIVMEYLPGQTLRARLRGKGPMAPAEAARVLDQITASLAEAHARGIVHRDLKPENVFLARTHDGGETVKVLDFGIASTIGPSGGEGVDAMTPGTPPYLAPEAIHGNVPHPRADVWAMGVVLYELLVGRTPWPRRPTAAAVLAAVLKDPVPPPAELNPSLILDATQEDLLFRCLAQQPRLRPRDAAELGRLVRAAFPDASSTPLDALAATDSPTAPDAVAGSLPSAAPRLPADLGGFFGRDAELAELDALFGQGSTRLVTLVGTGGIGKTRLALRHAHRAAAGTRYRGGVWMVDLTAARTLEHIAAAVAAALGVDVPTAAGTAATLTRLGHALDGRGPALVVLDNFEQIVDFGADTVARWADMAPAVHFLVTSRETLGLAGERTLRLAPLTVEEGAALFVERARSVDPDITVTEAEVADIVTRLDGIPLALELAASRLGVLTLDQLGARLAERFRLLEARRRRDLDPRHQTMRGAIDWSWELLDEAQRRALARCAVFRGGFTLEAAEAVLADPASGDVLDVLDDLVARSLVLGPRKGLRRFRLYESIREYAAERLEALAERQEAERRHAAYFAAFIEARSEALRLDRDEALQAIQDDRDNLAAVVERGAAAVGADPFDQVLTALINTAKRTVPLEGVLRVVTSALADATDDLRRARLQHLRADIQIYRGDVRAALGDIEACLPLLSDPADPGLFVDLRRVHGVALTHTGRLDEAWATLSEALDAAREAEDLQRRAALENLLAGVARLQGNMALAERLGEAALTRYRALGIRQSVAALSANLAMLAVDRGDLALARTRANEAVELGHARGHVSIEAMARVYLGMVALEEGDLHGARDLYAGALGQLRAIGSRVHEAATALRLAIVEHLLGRPAAARRLLEDVVAESDLARPRASALGYLGALDAEEDRPHVGAERLTQGQAALDGVGLSADAAGLGLLARVVALSRARARGEALGDQLEAMGEPTPAEQSHHMARAARLWVEAARARWSEG